MNTPIQLIPECITARTAEALKRGCLLNNLKDGRYYNYFSIQYIESESRWYAWFYREFELKGTKPNANAPKPG